MKILALGGSGGMGRFAVNSLIRHPQVESILVADLNESAAKRFASSLSEKTSGIGINVTDKEALERAMNEVDVVINTTGPFFKLAVPILKAAIETSATVSSMTPSPAPRWPPVFDTAPMVALRSSVASR